MASKAAKVLGNPKSTKSEKSMAGSVLTQAADKKKSLELVIVDAPGQGRIDFSRRSGWLLSDLVRPRREKPEGVRGEGKRQRGFIGL